MGSVYEQCVWRVLPLVCMNGSTGRCYQKVIPNSVTERWGQVCIVHNCV